METDQRIKQRFSELTKKAEDLQRTTNVSGHVIVDSRKYREWGTSALNLLQRVFGENSIHCQRFYEHFKIPGSDSYNFQDCWGTFEAAKEDYEGDYLFNLPLLLSGEIFGNFVALARSALNEGYKDSAAVLASVALEDALKRYASLNGLEVGDKSMQDVVNALKSKGLVGGAQKALLDTMPKLRDYAMHANWDKLTETEVGAVVGFVEQFLLSHFS